MFGMWIIARDVRRAENRHPAARAIQDTNGVVTTVSDDEILAAKAVVDAAGIGCESASAAAVAGARRLVREGVLQRGTRAVAVVTGHVLKDPSIVTYYHHDREPPPGANWPVEIDPELDAVERVMQG